MIKTPDEILRDLETMESCRAKRDKYQAQLRRKRLKRKFREKRIKLLRDHQMPDIKSGMDLKLTEHQMRLKTYKMLADSVSLSYQQKDIESFTEAISKACDFLASFKEIEDGYVEVSETSGALETYLEAIQDMNLCSQKILLDASWILINLSACANTNEMNSLIKRDTPLLIVQLLASTKTPKIIEHCLHCLQHFFHHSKEIRNAALNFDFKNALKGSGAFEGWGGASGKENYGDLYNQNSRGGVFGGGVETPERLSLVDMILKKLECMQADEEGNGPTCKIEFVKRLLLLFEELSDPRSLELSVDSFSGVLDIVLELVSKNKSLDSDILISCFKILKNLTSLIYTKEQAIFYEEKVQEVYPLLFTILSEFVSPYNKNKNDPEELAECCLELIDNIFPIYEKVQQKASSNDGDIEEDENYVDCVMMSELERQIINSMSYHLQPERRQQIFKKSVDMAEVLLTLCDSSNPEITEYSLTILSNLMLCSTKQQAVTFLHQYKVIDIFCQALVISPKFANKTVAVTCIKNLFRSLDYRDTIEYLKNNWEVLETVINLLSQDVPYLYAFKALKLLEVCLEKSADFKSRRGREEGEEDLVVQFLMSDDLYFDKIESLYKHRSEAVWNLVQWFCEKHFGDLLVGEEDSSANQRVSLYDEEIPG